MYCVQNRLFCGVCNKSVLLDKYSSHITSEGHVNDVLRNQCTNLMIKKTLYKKR